MRLLRDLWITAPRRTGVVALLIMIAAAGTAASAALAGPVLVHRSPTLFGLLSVALVLVVVSDLVVTLIVARLTADWAADVRRRLCRVAFGQPLSTLETTPVGELLDRIDGDVYQVSSELRGSGVRIAQLLATGVLSVLAALLVWWPAGLGMIVLAAVLAVGLKDLAGRITPARMAEEEAWSDLAAVMEEAIHGQDDVRTSLARPYVLKLFADRASRVLRCGRRVWWMSARLSAIPFAATRIGVALVVLGGGWAMIAGRIDAARLTAIWLLAIAYAGTVEHVSRMAPKVQYALGSWDRVRLLADSAQEPSGGAAPVDGDLAVRGLTFRYGTGVHRAALRDVDLTFVRGRSYALIGRTGSGKSTLAKVLTRAVDVPPGTVLLGGTDILDVDLEGLRRWIAVVPQRTEILAGTLAENVALFDPHLLDRAGDAMRELGLASWVDELPDGLATRLGDGGYALSAGQEQLVAFARILVRDPRVVILDEATARLDPVTEAAVQRATERLLRDRIGIVIAHRLSSLRHCDEVVVLADGQVVEAGPLSGSERFAALLASGDGDPAGATAAPTSIGAGAPTATATSGTPTATAASGAPTATAASGTATATARVGAASAGTATTGGGGVLTAVAPGDRTPPDDPAPIGAAGQVVRVPPKTDPPPLPSVPRVGTMREVFRLLRNDPRFGLAAIVLFLIMVLLGLDGPLLPWLWADVVDGIGDPLWPMVGIAAGLLCSTPLSYFTNKWFPRWWVSQMLRISLRLVHGQTGPRRVSGHTPAEVVAHGGDTERVVFLADNLGDQFIALGVVVGMTAISGSVVPGLFFVGAMVVSGVAALVCGPPLERSARRTVSARAAFATALVSSLSAARTVKLAGATDPVLAHLVRLEVERSRRQRQEISLQVWARSTPALSTGLLPIAAWALFLAGSLSAGATLVAVATLGAARWFAWTSASLVSQYPSAKVWSRRTVAMTGVAAYSAAVPGVDLSAGTAPAPAVPPRSPLRRLDLIDFGAVHDDGTLSAHGVRLTVHRGELVLVVGPVGSGKSSLLRALAGIVHHTGELRWNDDPVTTPELFLRPNQVAYVAQLPRVLSGTIAENIQLGHDVDAASAVVTAQLEHDLAVAAAGGTSAASTGAGGASSASTGAGSAGAGSAGAGGASADRGQGLGLDLLIGHKGTRLSGGQLQRLALARALAPRTELLIADDVSSALDVTTELELWRALRAHGVTVVGSTSKRAALARADKVVVLIDGAVAAQGTWAELRDHWGHLAG